MSIFIRLLLCCIPVLALGTEPGFIDVGANGFITVINGFIAVGPQGPTTNREDFSSFPITNGPYVSANGWLLSSAGARVTGVTTNSPPRAVRFFTNTGDADPAIQFPGTLSGLGYIEYYTRQSAGGQLTNVVTLERSTDSNVWTTVWTLPQPPDINWVKYATNIDLSGTAYFRFFCSGIPAVGSYYFDDLLWVSYP